jgi:hypothetical protein
MSGFLREELEIADKTMYLESEAKFVLLSLRKLVVAYRREKSFGIRYYRRPSMMTSSLRFERRTDLRGESGDAVPRHPSGGDGGDDGDWP